MSQLKEQSEEQSEDRENPRLKLLPPLEELEEGEAFSDEASLGENEAEQRAQSSSGPWLQPADFSKRFWAITIDSLAVFLARWNVMFFYQQELLTSLKEGNTAWIYWLSVLSIFLFSFVMIVVPTMVWGKTLGKLMMGLRVVNMDQNHPLKAFQVLLRETVGRIASGIGSLFVGYLLPIFRQDRRAIHDFLGNTQVVNEDAPNPRPVRGAAPSHLLRS